MSPTALPNASNTNRTADRLRREPVALIEAIEICEQGVTGIRAICTDSALWA